MEHAAPRGESAYVVSVLRCAPYTIISQTRVRTHIYYYVSKKKFVARVQKVD